MLSLELKSFTLCFSVYIQCYFWVSCALSVNIRSTISAVTWWRKIVLAVLGAMHLNGVLVSGTSFLLAHLQFLVEKLLSDMMHDLMISPVVSGHQNLTVT